MTMIGILGGMGPAATVDFMGKLVGLTPAQCDQDHVPMIIANLPQIPDRSRHILGNGPDPLPALLAGIALLDSAGVGLIVVPCNTSHHWYGQMAQHSKAPMLHIAQACVDALSPDSAARVSIFATRGAISSGFYQRELASRGIAHVVPDADGAQHDVDACIRAIKGGDMVHGGERLALALADAVRHGVQAVIMGCTELPVAAHQIRTPGLLLIDSSLELARQALAYAEVRGWNRQVTRIETKTYTEVCG
jgi:aspartate racemase